MVRLRARASQFGLGCARLVRDRSLAFVRDCHGSSRRDCFRVVRRGFRGFVLLVREKPKVSGYPLHGLGETSLLSGRMARVADVEGSCAHLAQLLGLMLLLPSGVLSQW